MSWIFCYFLWDIAQNRKSRVLHAKAGWSYLPFIVQPGTVNYMYFFFMSNLSKYIMSFYFHLYLLYWFGNKWMQHVSWEFWSILERANQIDLITDIVKSSILMECAVIAAANSRLSFLKLLFKENMHVLRMSYKMKMKIISPTTNKS